MLCAALFVFAVAASAWVDPMDSNAVLLTSVQSLVFYSGSMTTGRRTAPIRQLQCASGCSLTSQYPATAQCSNVGTGPNGAPTWRCQTQLPTNVRLGQIEVSCEGFRASDDPYVLVGSCALRYELLSLSGAPTTGTTKKSDPAVFGYMIAGIACVTLIACVVYSVVVARRRRDVPSAAAANPTVPTAIPVYSTDIEDPAAPVRIAPTVVHYKPAHTTFKSTHVSTGFGGTFAGGGGGSVGFGGTTMR